MARQDAAGVDDLRPGAGVTPGLAYAPARASFDTFASLPPASGEKVATPAPNDIENDAAAIPGGEPSARLLAARAGLAMWFVIASNLVFALTDLRLGREALQQVLVLKLLQIACAAGGLRALRLARSRRTVIGIVLAEAAAISGLTAWSGAVADDILTTVVLWIAVPFGTTVLMPWGALPQLGLVTIAGAAMLLNVYLARASLDLALQVPSLGVALTFAVSVYLAREFERQRRALALENERRTQAEESLRQTLEGLDQQVRERTRSLELANARLQEARDAAQTAEHRFYTISKLASDYTFSFRVNPDYSVVTEWLTEGSFERVTGYSTREIAAMGGGMALVHPDDMPNVIRRIHSLLAGNSDVSEFRILRKDGAVRWIREHGHPEWSAAENRVVRIYGAAQDVTAERLAEERLSEALHQRESVMNTVPDIIYTVDVEGRLRDWNRQLEIITGRAPEEIREASAIEMFAAEDRAPIAAAIQLAVAEGFAEVEARLAGPSGVRLYHFTGAALRDDHGRVVGISGVGRDISELKELQQRTADLLQVSGALARAGQELIAAIDRPDLLDRLCRLTAEVLDCDASCLFLWRPSEEAFVVAAADGLADETWETLRPLRFPREVFAGLLGVLAERDVVCVDMSAAPTRWAAVPAQFGFRSATYVSLRRGRETLGILAAGSLSCPQALTPARERIAEGVAQLASFALERAHAMEALEEASRLKSEFVATMSHELRTPLNILLGYNEMLRSGDLGPLTAEQLAVIERSDASARELLHLISNTLDLSRLETGRVGVKCTEVSLAELAAELADEMRQQRDKPAVAIAWELDEPLPMLCTDRGKLKVVLKNLLANAYKFTDEGRICVRLRAEGKQLHIEVEDTGIGIPPEALAYIFEPFRQVDSSTTRRHSGVGLGLHIVRRLLDLLGGTIDVRSEVGVGTAFSIRLPLEGAR